MTQNSTQVSKLVKAPRAAVYQACLDPVALAAWRVPDSMTAHVHTFEARQGGRFRMSLTYKDAEQRGKTSEGTDTFQGRFAELVLNEKIVELIEFESPDPRLAGEMKLTTSFKDTDNATEVTVLTEDIPAGIRPEDNTAGTQQALNKLAALLERRPDRPS